MSLSALALTLLILFVQPAHTNREVPTPMCTEVRGFAGEFNDRIRLPIERAAGPKEAIVLVVRAFPVELGFLTLMWLQMNATVVLAEGPSASVLSDENGFVILPSVKAGTSIDIRVNRIRKDGPVPFRFWSYHANRPTCHIEVSPSNSFIARIPASISSLSIPGSIFFKAVAPKGAKGLIINTHSKEVPTVEVTDSPRKSSGLVQKTGEIFSWMDEVAFFVYTPKLTGATQILVDISVMWTDSVNAAPHSDYGGEPGGTSKPLPLPSADTSQDAPGSGRNMKAEESIGHSLKRFFVVLFSLCLAYFVIMTIVNYWVRGLTNFPDMIPHIDFFSDCCRNLSRLKQTLHQSNSRGGYHDLNREELSTENI